MRPPGFTPVIRIARMVLCALFAIALAGAACQDFLGSGGSADGRIVWRTPMHEPIAGWFGKPAVVGNLAYFDATNSIVAIDTRDGRIAWSTVVRTEMFPLARNIVASNGTVFAAGDFHVNALDASSGALRWAVRTEREIYAPSAVDERALYVGTKGPVVMALALGDGAEQWRVEIGPDWEFQGTVTGLAVSGDTVYATVIHKLSYSGHRRSIVLVALDRLTGGELWRFETSADELRDTFDAPTVTARLLLISDEIGRSFFAVDRFTGELAWRTTAGGYYSGPSEKPTVVGNMVYVGSADTHVYAADLETGTVHWRTETGGSIGHLGVCGNKIFGELLEVAVLNRFSGKKLNRHFVRASDFVTSGFAVANRRAVASGNEAIYGFAC